MSKSPQGFSVVSRALMCAAALLFLQLGSAFGQEVIHSFDSVVRVAPDGTLTVTETIRVRAEGAEIKRGIYRDFPLTFRDTTGRTREVSFRLLGVMRDGRPEPHFTKRQGSFIRIYAGQEDVLLRRGDYTYTFSYETGRQLRWFDGGAELYWNVTGNEWNFPIYQATVRVELPGSARPARWAAYTGPLGARGTAWRGSVNSGGALVAETTQRLGRHEGFTIVVELPAGTVQPPGPATRFWYVLLDNRNWIFGGLGLLFVLGYYAFAWRAVGRDPKGGTIIPLFHPPEKVSPALANYVRNWGFSDQWRAFTAAALSLAVRGLLVFDERDGNLTLKATGRAPDGNLPPAELAILQWVQGQSGSVAISSENGTAVAEIVKQFRSRIEAESKNRFFRRNLGYFLVGAGITVITIIGIMVFGGLEQEEYVILFAIMFASVWLGAFLIPILHSIFKAASASAIFRVALGVLLCAWRFLLHVGAVPGQRARHGRGYLVPRGRSGPGPSVSVRARDDLRNGEWLVPVPVARADRPRPARDGPAGRSAALSHDCRDATPEHAGAGNHDRAIRGFAALRGRARCRGALVERICNGVRPRPPRRGLLAALSTDLARRRRLVER